MILSQVVSPCIVFILVYAAKVLIYCENVRRVFPFNQVRYLSLRCNNTCLATLHPAEVHGWPNHLRIDPDNRPVARVLEFQCIVQQVMEQVEKFIF